MRVIVGVERRLRVHERRVIVTRGQREVRRRQPDHRERGQPVVLRHGSELVVHRLCASEVTLRDLGIRECRQPRSHPEPDHAEGGEGRRREVLNHRQEARPILDHRSRVEHLCTARIRRAPDRARPGVRAPGPRAPGTRSSAPRPRMPSRSPRATRRPRSNARFPTPTRRPPQCCSCRGAAGCRRSCMRTGHDPPPWPGCGSARGAGSGRRPLHPRRRDDPPRRPSRSRAS